MGTLPSCKLEAWHSWPHSFRLGWTWLVLSLWISREDGDTLRSSTASLQWHTIDFWNTCACSEENDTCAYSEENDLNQYCVVLHVDFTHLQIRAYSVKPINIKRYKDIIILDRFCTQWPSPSPDYWLPVLLISMSVTGEVLACGRDDNWDHNHSQWGVFLVCVCVCVYGGRGGRGATSCHGGFWLIDAWCKMMDVYSH